MKQFPQWIKRPMPTQAIEQMNQLLKEFNLHTVCQSARCPNIGECFKNKEATFMILGNICTRNCHFCSVKKGIPEAVDNDEPNRIAEAVKRLNLEYVVITSVTRDDLADGGAGIFASAVGAIRSSSPDTKVEVLTPDFNNNTNALNTIINATPDVFSHNIETAPRLYKKVRPKTDYQRSLGTLRYVKNNSDILTKSGIMLGLGEKDEEVLRVIEDLSRAACDILTIGQYLKPSKDSLDVTEFVSPEKFEHYKRIAQDAGFASVNSGPFVRSSYMAKEAYLEAIYGCSYA